MILIVRADEGDGVVCILRHADGTTEAARTDWLVGCDGARSTVREQLKLDFAGDTLPQSFVLADVAIRGLLISGGRFAERDTT